MGYASIYQLTPQYIVFDSNLAAICGVLDNGSVLNAYRLCKYYALQVQCYQQLTAACVNITLKIARHFVCIIMGQNNWYELCRHLYIVGIRMHTPTYSGSILAR